MVALLFLVFLSLLALGTEVGFTMIVAAWLGIMSKTDRVVDAVLLPSSMMSSISYYALVQIPLFILAGEIMNRGGITQRLIDVATVWAGGVRGSLGHVAIGSNFLLSGISGSAVADAIATGKALIPAMQRRGYGDGFAGAVIAAGALLGPMIPPSIPMVVYAQIANESVARLFLSGVLPAILLSIGFIVICSIIARRRGFPAEPEVPARERLLVTGRAFWALMMPVIILVGIRFGLVTDTEVAAVAVVYAIGVSVFIYRTLALRDVPGILVAAGRSSAVILFLIAAAGPFSWLIAESQVSELVVSLIRGISDNPIVILLIVNVFLVVVGLAIEPLPAMIIFLPALLPISVELGIDPIQFGAIVVFNLVIGLLTPPVGLLLFVVCGMARIPFVTVSREVIPFLLWSFVVLIAMILYPPLTIWLGQGL